MANGTSNLNSSQPQMPFGQHPPPTGPRRAAAAICDYVRSAVVILVCLVVGAVTLATAYLCIRIVIWLILLTEQSLGL